MIVGPDTWVTVHYRLFDSNGEPVESGEREITYLHGGHGAIFDALEQALDGKAVGDEVSVYLQPEDTFGDYDAELLRLVPRAQMPAELEPGMTFEGVPGEEADGQLYIATDVTDEAVVLDGNHPLAGLALRFALEIVDLREASAEEIADEAARRGTDPDEGRSGLLH